MKYKVYGGLIYHCGQQYRCVIATTSENKIIKILKSRGIRISIYEIRTYWCETGNAVEVKKTLSKPDIPFYTKNNFHNNIYKEFNNIGEIK